MATYDLTALAAPQEDLHQAFAAKMRAEGFLDEEGFFIGPPDDLELLQVPKISSESIA